MSKERKYDNVREFLGCLIGMRLVDITQADPDELAAGENFIMFMFEDGRYVKFPIGKEGFGHNCEGDEVRWTDVELSGEDDDDDETP